MAPAAGVGSGEVKLSWTAPLGRGAPITDYLIERSDRRVTWTHGQSTACRRRRVDTVAGLTERDGRTQFRVGRQNAVGDRSVRAPPMPGHAARGRRPCRALTAAVAPAAGVGFGRGEADLDGAGVERWVGGHRLRDRAVRRTAPRGRRWTTGCRRRRLHRGGLTNGTTYQFRVAAVNAVGAGPASARCRRRRVGCPAAPAALTAAVAPAAGVGSGEVQLTWTAPTSNGGSAITDYLIERSTDGVTWTTVDDGVSTATTFTVGRADQRHAVQFRVAAVNALG